MNLAGPAAAAIASAPAGDSRLPPVQHGSRIVEQQDITNRLELLVIEDVIYGTPTTVFEVHCWDCQGTDEFDSRDAAITYGHERHSCRD